MITKEDFCDEFAELADQAGITETCAVEFTNSVRTDERSYAAVEPHDLHFYFAPDMLKLSWQHRRGLIMHELGHVLCKDMRDGGTEDDADRAARECFGERIIYDKSWPGKGLQCVKGRKNPGELPPGFDGFDEEAPSEKKLDCGSLLGALRVGDIVKVGSTRWEVRRTRGVSVFVIKQGTSGSKLYKLNAVSLDPPGIEIRQVYGGSGEIMEELPPVAGGFSSGDPLVWSARRNPQDGYSFVARSAAGQNEWTITATTANGLPVGEAQFVGNYEPDRDDEDGYKGLKLVGLKGWEVNVHPDHRREGLATAMYQAAEREWGLPIVAGDFQTPEGAAFLKGRDNPPEFRTPTDMADAESQLKRLARNMKKAQTERKDAAAAYYDIGVRIAEERIAELDLAIEHFSKWVASQNRKNPTYALIHRPVGQFHVPAGYKEFGTHPDFKFGTVTYDAPLPPAEIEHWSLIDVSRSNEDIAREIADGLMEYANEQIEDAQDDPRGFAVGVGQYIDRMRVHADRAVIAPLVLEVLRARAVRENPRTNRYAAACHACGARVAEGAGTLEGPPWRTFCAACLPQTAAQAPAPRRADSRILATLGPRNTVEFRLEGHAGGAFQDYRRACAPCKAVKEGDAWVNRISMADAGPVLEAMAAISGLQLVVDDEVMGALKGRVVDVGGRLDAAKTRLEAVEGQLAARGHELYPFQRHGVEWLATQDAAILADDMGLGKTGQALVAAPQNAPILVIGPAVAKGVWIREAAKWRPDLHPILLSGRTSFRWPKPSEMVVTNYDILADQLLAAPQGVVVIADEAHALKNNKAKRTQRFRLVADAAREAGGVVWLLTATPLLGKPPELWALLQAIDRIPFSGFSEFGRLMGGEKVYDRGAKREIWEWDGTPDPEAAERLKLVMLRRMKTEVLTELPPKRYQTIEVELEKGVQRKLTAALKKWDAVARPDELPPFEQMSAARADLAAAKIPAMLELVEEFEEAGEPVVVFSAHRAPIDILDERPGWAIITGDTPPDVRSQIEEAFQRGELKGIGATIQAGGIAITLTRASNAVFVDLDWTPALNAQAEDRIYRIGQDRGVLITRLVADHEMDRRLLEVLSEKQNRIDASVDAARRGGDESLVSADEAERLDRLADTLARKMAGMSEELAEILEAQEDYRARVAHLDQQARDRAEREIQERWQREIRERAERRGLDIAEADDTDMHSPATPTQKWAAEALMTLTELDTDRARDENAMGFNKADTRVGQALAMRAATGGLTDLEWRFAIAMLRKYWRQVGRAPEANPPQSSIMLSAHPETERAYEDWLILADGSDIVFPLEKEGYGWVYLAPAGVPELEVEHVLITDEFPLATIVVAKKMLNPRLVGEHGMLIVGPDSQREYRVRAIMDFYREHPGPIVLTNHQRNDWAALVHPATRIGVGWQGSMFDKDGPFSHVESGTAEGAVRELVGEWGFRVPDPDAMERVLGKRANLC